MDFNEMLSKITDNADKIVSYKSEKRDYTDDRFWKPTRGADGNGLAIVRLLPDICGNVDLPYVEVIKYSFKHDGKWYINNSRRSLGEKEADPVYEINGKLYTSGQAGDEAHAALAKKMNQQYRKYANVLIIDDKQKPEFNGQVKLFDMSNQVFEKITDANAPKDEYTKKINAFHPIEGANMIIRVKSKDIGLKEPISDLSDTGFLEQSALFDGDEEKIMEVLKKQYDLVEFTKPEYFRPYDDLLSHLKYVIGADFYHGIMGGIVPKVDNTTSQTMTATEPETNQSTEIPSSQQTELEEFIAKTKAEMAGNT